jgi:hypothetical protein
MYVTAKRARAPRIHFRSKFTIAVTSFRMHREFSGNSLR